MSATNEMPPGTSAQSTVDILTINFRNKVVFL